ncbi:MAG: TIGR03960 family B12-binding radical SAM protein [Oscillospiraceae bacterium]|jgi:radical SAM family uncharacterized protein/radical SAM-linked protein|nr:TIGR03960 family B12-binding radical SAM protein [Oscillospiraceae bacterium]
MINKQVEKILLNVQKPGRYTGGELNSVVKDKTQVDVRFAFCFPDVYEVGMSHLGMKILYSLYNNIDYVWCERAFAPWIDMEEQMSENNIPLFALESGDALADFDILGFTLQYELSYTNMLNMLRLGKIPLLSEQRTTLKNLVIAGGPCTCNPEPLAGFVDVFVLGEGEEVSLELLELYREYKKAEKSKAEFLTAAAQIEGVYVPALYNVDYNEDKTIAAVTPLGNAPKTIKKRFIKDLDTAFYPQNFVVPNIEIIHDRAVQEIFRGCFRGCRFCQAGFIYRPIREKSIETIQKQCRCLCENTGYDEVSLSSLSSTDYSKIEDLLEGLQTWTKDGKVSISLPSLRVDGFSDAIVNQINTVRKSGLTFAPEAGSQRMRDVINKNVTRKQLLQTCTVAFNKGWTTVKLYFMLGLPTETDEDIEAIAKLGMDVVGAFHSAPMRNKSKGVRVTLSASSFVPKPFTPFQWEPQDSLDEIRRKQQLIKSTINTKKISFNYHDADTSFLEAVFARGDRNLQPALMLAAERGFHFDGWNDCFSLEKWLQIFEDCGIDPHFYANRRRSYDEVLPWEHLDYRVQKSFLQAQAELANSLTPENWQEKSEDEQNQPEAPQTADGAEVATPKPLAENSSKNATYAPPIAATAQGFERTVRVWFKKTEGCKYISHLDLNRVMMRALHKSGIPVWHTEGFNPHPFCTFALPLSLGFAGENESMDIRLTDSTYSYKDTIKNLNVCLPSGLSVFAVTAPVMKPGKIAFAEFLITLESSTISTQEITEQLQKFFAQKEVFAQKKTKSGKIETQELIAPIKQLEIGQEQFKIVLPAGSKLNINPNLYAAKIKEFLTGDVHILVARLNLFDENMQVFE